MRVRIKRGAGIVAAVVLILGISAGPGLAAVWVGAASGGDGTSWGDPLNWDTGVVPTGGTTITIDGSGFGATSGSPQVIDLGGVDRDAMGTTSVSNVVRFVNGDFNKSGSGVFTATDVQFATGVGIGSGGTATNAGELHFTRVSYNMPLPASNAPRGFQFLGTDASFIDSSVTSHGTCCAATGNGNMSDSFPIRCAYTKAIGVSPTVLTAIDHRKQC